MSYDEKYDTIIETYFITLSGKLIKITFCGRNVIFYAMDFFIKILGRFLIVNKSDNSITPKK